METQNDILNELKSWNSPLAGMSRSMPYLLPQGYFEHLPAGVLDSIRAADAELSLPAQKTMPYSVPSGYFESLPEQILKAVHANGTNLPKQTPFEVPEGYFGQLPIQMLQAAKQADQRTVKTISLGRKVGRSLRWAAAAVLLLGIGIGSYKMLTPSTAPASAQKQLMAVSQDEISNYVQQHIDDFDGDMIENSVASVDPLQSVSEDDIVHYLDETGWGTSNIN